MSTFCYSWNDADFTWIANEFTWDDVCIALEVGGGDSGDWLGSFGNLDEKKKKRFIELSCIVKYGRDYKPETRFKEKKQKKDIQLSAKDIEVTVKTILEVSLITEDV